MNLGNLNKITQKHRYRGMAVLPFQKNITCNLHTFILSSKNMRERLFIKFKTLIDNHEGVLYKTKGFPNLNSCGM